MTAEIEFVEFTHRLGIDTCLEFAPQIMIPEERIRGFCRENKCGHYGNSYMCPPYVGSLEEIKVRLKRFRRGLLLQYVKDIDVRGDKEGVRRTKIDFHRKILQMEKFLKKEGIDEMWGIIGGNCELCDICGAKNNEPCLYPDKARTSLEGIGIDVLGLLDTFNLDTNFYTDKIMWTGCILF